MISNIIKLSILAKHELENYNSLKKNLKKIKNQKLDHNILKQLNTKGYAVVSNFFKTENLDDLVSRLDKFYLRPNKNDKNYRVGGARWQNIEKNFPEVKKIFFDNKLIKNICNSYFKNGVNNFKKIVYQHSYYEKDLKNINKKQLGLGREWHCDTWKNEIKLMLFCSNINEENGPLRVIPESHKIFLNPVKLDYAKKILSTIYPSKFDSDNLFFELNDFDYKSKVITGLKGDLAIFNTRCLHKASFITKGNRKVIWVYF